MSNQTVEELWRSLGNDGLAGLFETDSSSGLLATILSALAPSEVRPSGSRLSQGSVRDLTGQNVISDLLGVLPLAGGLLRTLLDGPTEPATTPAVRYSLPGSVRLGTSLGTTFVTDGSVPWAGQLEEATRQTNPTVVINVNALDSRSILDRSDDIASAVRQAMLTYQPFDDIWR